MIAVYMVWVALAGAGAYLEQDLLILVAFVGIAATLLVDGVRWWGHHRQQMDRRIYDYEQEQEDENEDQVR